MQIAGLEQELARIPDLEGNIELLQERMVSLEAAMTGESHLPGNEGHNYKPNCCKIPKNWWESEESKWRRILGQVADVFDRKALEHIIPNYKDLVIYTVAQLEKQLHELSPEPQNPSEI